MFIDLQTGERVQLVAHDSDVTYRTAAGKLNTVSSHLFFSTHREATAAEAGDRPAKRAKIKPAAPKAAPKPKGTRRASLGGKGPRKAAPGAHNRPAADKAPPGDANRQAGAEPEKK